MTWHAAFVLEFENSLLAIDGSIKALPYWDATKTTPSVFTDKYFGSAPGTGEGSRVIDGAFPSFGVTTKFDLGVYKDAAGT